MSNRTTHHATFVIDRIYAAPRELVYNAFADPAAKTRWFAGPGDWTSGRYLMDFRVGGKESISGGPPGGPVHHYNATYQEIVPNERIISTYDMHMDDKRISVSLATVEFTPAASGTRVVYTEQGVFLDGLDSSAEREHGTNELLNALAASLERDATPA
jgi:uncharacterized protein YndB with AHSA1/START domain